MFFFNNLCVCSEACILCSASVSSVLVYDGMYPISPMFVSFISDRVFTICVTVYLFFSWYSRILYTKRAMKHVRKCALIAFSVDTYTGLDLNSVFMMWKHSSICHLLLFISIIFEGSSSISVMTVLNTSRSDMSKFLRSMNLSEPRFLYYWGFNCWLLQYGNDWKSQGKA